jgi:hypothetical protein
MANQIKKKYLAPEVISYFDDQIDAAEGLISGLDGRLTTAEGDISALESDVSGLDSRLSTAETDIDNLEGRMTTAESDIDAVEGRMTTAEGDIDALEIRMTTAEMEIDGIDSRLQTAEGEIDVIQAALPLKADLVGGLVPASQLPSYVDDVLEFNDLASFPVSGESGKIYVAKDTNKTYRWSGSVYVYITSGAVDSVFGRTGVVTAQSGDYNSDQVTEGSANLYYTAARQSAIEAYADQAEADAKAYADGLDSAMDARVDALEAIEWASPYKKTLSAGDVSSGYIDLPALAVETNGMSVFVDRLAMHQGASEDYTLSVVGGVTRITFLNDLVNPGNQALQAGDSIFVRYQVSV